MWEAYLELLSERVDLVLEVGLNVLHFKLIVSRVVFQLLPNSQKLCFIPSLL